ncbi:MAG: ATP-binding protein [Ferroplasma sp.]|uniref:AAA family ATPase n=1 Tax=Ferroplasma sp. TaxID=2591003 RepID=UPI002814BC7C|nr:ATP-binding protein [Ferroplasma sp.]WMT51654.1 MAG: ATP-binding protein [Ferroplasma sp.]
MLFIDRKNELNMLYSAYKRSMAELVLITGRRRMGKTELIKKCINEHKGVLLTCREESEKLMLERSSIILGNYFQDDFIIKNSIKSWDSFFEYRYKNTLNEKSIIAIDEFSYALNNKSLQSLLQDYLDNKLKSTRIFLILSGSNISMM